VIVEAPDETTGTAMTLAAIVRRHLRATKTTLLLWPPAMVEAMKRASGVSGGEKRKGNHFLTTHAQNMERTDG
jgi:hypothetical protein